MPDQIPHGITAAHILQAINDLDHNAPHGFGDSISYDVLFKNRRYPPKAVIGLAAGHVTGTALGPGDFKGGLKSKCFRVLEDNGFTIVTKGDALPFPDELSSEEIFSEGNATRVLVNRYERDPKARAVAISHYGYQCLVCEFDFEKVYGPLGKGFVHVHHIVPLAETDGEYAVDPIADLRPVCPNCHAMLHRRSPPFTIEELQAIFLRAHQP